MATGEMSILRRWSAEILGWARRIGLTKNLGLKLGAVVLALALVAYVDSRPTEQAVFDNVALQAVNIPPDLTVAVPLPSTVSVRLKGSPAALERINRGELGIELDLARAQQGSQIMLLAAESVRVPFNVEVEEIEPSQLDVVLEQKVTRKIPIVANLTGEVPQGFRTAETTVDPPEARVRGAETAVTDTVSVTTQPVPLNGRRNSFTTQVRVLSPRSNLEVVSPEEATVRVRVEEVRAERTLEVRVETVGEAAGRLQINPRVLPITIEGPVSQVDAIQAADLRVWVDVRGMQPQRSDYHLRPEVAFRRPEAFPGVDIRKLGQGRIDVHVYPATQQTEQGN